MEAKIEENKGSKIIRISVEHYENLKNCGRAGDSFNSVLDKIFENKEIINKIHYSMAAAALDTERDTKKEE